MSKSKQNRSASNQVGNAFQTLVFDAFARIAKTVANVCAQHAFVPCKYIL